MSQPVFDAETPILCAQWSPCAELPDLVFYGTSTRLCILRVQLGQPTAQQLAAVSLGTSVQQLCLAPSLVADASGQAQRQQQHLLLCAVGSDRGLHVLQAEAAAGDLAQLQQRGTLRGHSEPVAAAALEAGGSYLASTGADCTLRLWDAQAMQQITVLRLTSPGVAVQWYPATSSGAELPVEKRLQVMVAESAGTVRLCHVDQRYPLLSLHCHTGLLTSMDWSPLNTSLVAATAGDSWLAWNTKNSSIAHGVQRLTRPHARLFRWCTSVENAFAVASASHVELCRLTQTNEQQLVREVEGDAVDLSWHCSRPTCLVVMGSQLILVGLEG